MKEGEVGVVNEWTIDTQSSGVKRVFFETALVGTAAVFVCLSLLFTNDDVDGTFFDEEEIDDDDDDASLFLSFFFFNAFGTFINGGIVQ